MFFYGYIFVVSTKKLENYDKFFFTILKKCEIIVVE